MEELHRYVDTATLACSNNINDSDLLQLQNALDEFDPQLVPTSSSPSDFDELIKSQIVTHPRYPELLSAYIDCRKVGAAPEMASLLEEIRREQKDTTTTICNDLGVDSELDEFMDSYCEILQRYKEDLSKPFDEATTFLNNLESQLNNLCSDPLIPKTCDYGTGSSENNSLADEAAVVSSPSSEEESGGENDQASESQESSGGNEGIKVMLLRKYSGHLSNLRKEFMKTRKKGKLPKEAKSTLLNWWNSHYRWPYPTEEEKMKLAETTRLDQKQINNWFINQRKRHWKPSEDIRLAVMEGVRSTTTVSGPAYFDTAEPNYTITYP